MLIDLVSTENYNQYNIQLANMFGLDVAVYLNEIINIYNKAIRKEKVSDCFFELDREYVKKRTTLSLEDQFEIDNKLTELEILTKDKSNVNLIKLDIILLVNLMSSEDENLKNHLHKLLELKNKKVKASKQTKISEALKAQVDSKDPLLDDFLRQWIDSVVAKEGWMTKGVVLTGQEKVIQFAFPDKEKAIEIIKIAIVNGYRDMDWAIQKYKENKKSNNNLISIPQVVKINPDLKF